MSEHGALVPKEEINEDPEEGPSEPAVKDETYDEPTDCGESSSNQNKPQHLARRTSTLSEVPVYDHIQNVLQNKEGVDPLSVKVGVAPHVISIAGVGFIATSKRCSAYTYVEMNDLPLLDDEHSIHFPQLENDAEAVRFVKMLIGKFTELGTIYNITIENALNHSGQTSYPTVAVAVWQSLCSFGEIEDKMTLIEKLMLLDLKVEEKEPVIKATLLGSDRFMWLKHEPVIHPRTFAVVPEQEITPYENDPNRSKIDAIKQLDFIFVRSNLHNANFEEKLLAENSTLRDLKYGLKNDFDRDEIVMRVMNEYSRNRISRYMSNDLMAKHICSENEVDCYLAMENVRQDEKYTSRIGIQIQQGGVLMAMQKEVLNDGFLEQISRELANESRHNADKSVTLSTVRIDIIEMAGGAILVDQQEASLLPRENGYEYGIKLRPVLKRRPDRLRGEMEVPEKMVKEEMVEEGEHDDEHDDTRDESQDG